MRSSANAAKRGPETGSRAAEVILATATIWNGRKTPSELGKFFGSLPNALMEQLVSIRNTGGTDHLSFAAVGLPGFQFIQDPLDYGTVTHHSNMDTWDHAVPEDLMQTSAVIATMVYETATRKEMLPRRELPKPE